MTIPALPSELGAFDAKALADDPGSLVAIRDDGTILWFNAGWRRFAGANGGDDVPDRFGVGASYFEAISGTLRGFYEELVLDCADRQEPFEQQYECSSPTSRRTFRMRVLPAGDHVLLVSHSLVVEEPVEAAASEPLDDAYRAPTGLVTMCSNCRRVRRADQAQWDWVPAWVSNQPARVSHGICALCMGYYYGAYRASRSRK